MTRAGGARRLDQRSLRRRLLALGATGLLIAACAGPQASPPVAPASEAPASPAGASPAATMDVATAVPTEAATAEPTAVATAEPTAVATASPSEAPTTAPTDSPMPAPTAGEGEFLNPVIDTDFPDPHVILADDDMYYAYATTGGNANIRVARSADLVEWEMLGDALPILASWSGFTPLFELSPHRATWAPEVHETSAGYVMYYTTPAVQIPRPDNRPSQCIGTAVSENPEGPFVDDSEGPIVCQAELGGSIDATFFRDDDDTQYLIWKNDGNCCAQPTRFYIQELSDDGLAVVGEPTDLGMSNDKPWERFVIEAPTLIRNEDTYYLFYSGNDFASASYAVGYATAEDVLGPYVDAEENPILTSEPPAAGPGHQSVVEDRDGDLWMTFHAWDFSAVGYGMGGRRAMWIDELRFEDGRPVVDGPEVGPQPAPP